MLIPSDDEILRKLRDLKEEVHGRQVTSDRSVMVYDATYIEHEGPVPNVLALFALMCISVGDTFGTVQPNRTSSAILTLGASVFRAWLWQLARDADHRICHRGAGSGQWIG